VAHAGAKLPGLERRVAQAIPLNPGSKATLNRIDGRLAPLESKMAEFRAATIELESLASTVASLSTAEQSQKRELESRIRHLSKRSVELLEALAEDARYIEAELKALDPKQIDPKYLDALLVRFAGLGEELRLQPSYQGPCIEHIPKDTCDQKNCQKCCMEKYPNWAHDDMARLKAVACMMECADAAGACYAGLFKWPQIARCDIPDCSQFANTPEQQQERMRCEQEAQAALMECAEKKLGDLWALARSLLEDFRERANGMIRGLTRL
jgi:hypothetical protein